MGNFGRDNGRGGGRGGFGGGGRSFGGGRGGFGGGGRSFGRSSFDRGGERRTQMHNAVCANCGKDCEVPFRPTGDRPVYCSDCFEKMGGGSERNDRNDSRRDNSRGDRPQRAGNDSYKKDFETLNAKLDRILHLLTPQKAEETSQKEEIPVQEKTVETPQEETVEEIAVEKTPKKKASAKKK